MINFTNLSIKVDKNYSFIGIKKEYNNTFFYLPKGFEAYVAKDKIYAEKRDLFFQFYKIINTFKEICAAKGYLQDDSKLRTPDRDGVIKSNSGSGIQDNQEETKNIFYSKLDIIGSLLNAYDEPKILALAYRLGKSDKFDVSKIHRYLHQAIYLPNNAAYVDQMTLPKKVVQFESTDIVAMYCYLFCEVKQQLQESVTPEIASLAESFRQHYLGSQDSIFDEQTYEQTLNTLKDALETIDRNTPIKDADYWQYYEAIELFLYGDFSESKNGEIWGISNFWSVWESMCLTYLAENIDSSSLLELDTQYISNKLSEKLKISTKFLNLSNIFKINNRYLRPDAVIVPCEVSKIEVSKDYRIESYQWNDYGYNTTISILDIGEIKIAFTGQEYEHTTQDLREIYPIDKRGRIIVDSQVPSNFYSYWVWKNANELNLDNFQIMYCFNHFFYLAFKQKIFGFDEFIDKIFKPLDISINDRNGNFDGDNVFSTSLLRYTSVKNLEEDFNDFVRQVLKFGVIDIKYLTEDYFKDANNIEQIKRRSIRKQFVYEHLLQKKLFEEYKENKEDIKFTINSSLWLPSYRPDDPNLIEDGSTFMDGYVQLKNVNFKILADNYVA